MPSKQLQTLVEMLRARPTLADESIAEMRSGFEEIARFFPLPPDVTRTAADAGGVPAEWISAPGARSDRALLHLHGGGYIIGSLATHRELAARLSRACLAPVLLLDYRLAPEHPFPAALEDATSAYRWLLAQGLSPNRVAVCGDSAGGGLALSLLVAARDAGQPLPATAVCLSPWTDLESSGESMTRHAEEDPIVQRDWLLRAAQAYLAGTADPRNPLASPLYADLRGLPPLLVQVGTAETLLDDARRLAVRARQAGVETTLEVCDEMIHVWQLFAALLPEGQQAIERIGAFVETRLA